MSIPIIDAEVFLECQNELGEGILWDSKKQLLHWVDLTQAEVHSLEPSSKKYSVDKYPESRFVTAIALRKGQPGFLALIQDSVVILPQTEPTEPFAKTFKKTEQKSSETLQKPQFGNAPGKLVRFNDGAASPDGRYFAGSMALPEHRGKAREGELWRLDTDGKMTKVLSEVGTSNGIGWSLDHKTMYFIDSHADRIDQFDYDISTGEISNRRQFAVSPPPTDDKTPTRGVPDGLSMDGNGNIWVARWMDSRVIGYRPDGSIICFIRCKEALSPTIPCFGGPNLDVMYIATAHSKMAGLNGDIQKDMPHSGDLYTVDFGPDSEVRKILGENWKGAERFRYGASGGSRM